MQYSREILGPPDVQTTIPIDRWNEVPPSVGYLRSGRSGVGPFDTRGLGGRNEPAVRTASGNAATSRDGSTEAACRRRTSSSVGAWEWKNQDRSPVDLRARRPTGKRSDSTARYGSPTRWIARGTPTGTREQVQGHVSSRCLDAYAGFEKTYERGRNQEATCWPTCAPSRQNPLTFQSVPRSSATVSDMDTEHSKFKHAWRYRGQILSRWVTPWVASSTTKATCHGAPVAQLRYGLDPAGAGIG